MLDLKRRSQAKKQGVDIRPVKNSWGVYVTNTDLIVFSADSKMAAIDWCNANKIEVKKH